MCLNLTIMFTMALILLVSFVVGKELGDIITEGSHDYVFTDIR